jgi:CheY-like chemotaxis protein
MLSQIVAPTLSRPSAASAFPCAPLQASPILLVEDNPYNAKLMLIYLKKLKYDVLWAKSGQEMWELLEATQPGLVLMDINLPETDGLALTRQLRSHSLWHSIPIIVQTAMAMRSDRDACFRAGATDYITKPIDLQQLAGMIVQCLGHGGS